MIKSILSLFLLAILFNAASAQDFPYGQFSWDELNMKSYKNDTSAHAVVLNEYATTWISTNDRLRLEHEYHVKIKIFDSKGFKEGDVEIPVYIGNPERADAVTDIEGRTTYVGDNGTNAFAELEKKAIFRTNENKYWGKVKFAMPNIRNGCVIEYRYKFSSSSFDDFKAWQFQSHIPKIYSAYKVRIPGILNYNISIRGPLKLLEGPEYKGDRELDCFSLAGVKADCSRFLFAMKDIPAFKEEEHMTASKNFISGIYFELQDYYNINNGAKMRVSQEWKDVDRILKAEEAFGSQLKKKDYFKDKLPPVLAGKATDLEKARAVYSFIQKNIKWNKFIGIYSSEGIRNAFEKHTGTIGDINLALVAALNCAGINTEAVLLSTRDHGLINKLYPVISEFNYVVAKVNIGDKVYYADASDELLPFGILPLHCLNDQGRAFSVDKPSYWVDFTPSEKNSTYMLDFVLQENGKMKGKITNYSMGYDSYLKRKRIKSFNTVDEYVEDLDERQPRMKILSSDIKNVDSLDLPVLETYEVEMDLYDAMDAKKLTFNPFILQRIIENPFKLTERTYPVDMGMPSSERISLSLTLPEGYTVENPPKDINFSLPNSGGKFVTQFTGQGGTFNFSHLISFKKPVYSIEEYPYLKEFYNQVILSEKNDLVFKKK